MSAFSTAYTLPTDLIDRLNRQLEASQYSGPLLTMDWLIPEGVNLVEQLRIRARQAIIDNTNKDLKRPHIYFDFFQDYNINALAMRLEADLCILISVGAWIKFSTLFNNLLSTPDFLPMIGDESNENPLDSQIKASSEAGITNLWEVLTSPKRVPNDPIRKVASTVLTDIAFDYLVLHELGHIRNGHLFLNLTANQIIEVEPPSHDQDSSLTRQTLEMDADSHAVLRGLNSLFRRTGAAFTGPYKEALTIIHKTRQLNVSLYLTAIYVLFRIFEQKPWQAEGVWLSTHPPASMRLFMNFMTIYSAAAQAKDEETLRLLPNLVGSTINSVEQSMNALSSVKQTYFGLGQAIKSYPTYMPLLERRWAELYPKLEAAKLGANLAPPQISDWSEKTLGLRE
jgi:hypothetical protein